MTDNQVQIFNNCNFSINVYDTFSEEKPTSEKDISTNLYDYWPKYTLIGNVKANDSAEIPLERFISRLVITKEENLFPVSLYVISSDDDDDDKVLHIVEDGFQQCLEAHRFYQLLFSQPYSPVCLEYHALIKSVVKIDLDSIETRINAFFHEHGYLCGYDEFSLVTFWAQTYLYAYENRYYVYQGGNYREFMGFLMNNEPLGHLEISNNTAIYTPARPDNPKQGREKKKIPLFYKYGALVKEADDIPPPGSSKNPAKNSKGWTLILRKVKLKKDEPKKIVACFIGKIEGIGSEKPVIVQPYELPCFPWWVSAYDIAKLAFFTAEVAMGLHMAYHVLKSVGSFLAFLGKNIQSFLKSVFNKLTEQGKSSKITPEEEPVTDPDPDPDPTVDPDPVIEIPQKTFVQVIRDLCRIVMQNKSRIFMFLIKNAAFIGAFEGIRKVLELWEKRSKEELDSLAPQEFVGMGLLVSYMTDSKNPIKTRWITLSHFVQELSEGAKGLEGKKSLIHKQLVIIDCIIKTDSISEEISWSKEQETDLIAQMAPYTSIQDQYKVYSELLANYQTRDKKELPIKIGCSAVKKHLTKAL